MPKRCCEVLPVSEEVTVLHLIRGCQGLSKRGKSTHEVLQKEKEIRAGFASSLKLRKLPATWSKCLVQLGKTLRWWVEANRRCVPTDGRALCPKALSLSEDFSKGSPERSDTKPLTVSQGQ